MISIDPVIYQQLCQTLGVNKIYLEETSGGSINKTFKLLANNRTLFCKVNSATNFPHLFKTEAAGLQLLNHAGPLRTPKVIGLLETHSFQILLLEWIERSTPNHTFWKSFGEGLAALHSHTQSLLGLETDNFMGSIPQKNKSATDWPTFFIQNRLEPLVQQCHSQQLLTTHHLLSFQKLYTYIPGIFNEQSPALLHGDLWSGNYLCAVDKQPVLIDPATYYGHPSIDLAMTTLFGGFDKAFYEAYHYHTPLPTNYKEQWKVCNLYPLLIHLLLFGKSYLSSIESTLSDFQ